jgi:hypothetical protein
MSPRPAPIRTRSAAPRAAASRREPPRDDALARGAVGWMLSTRSDRGIVLFAMSVLSPEVGVIPSSFRPLAIM